VGLGVAATVGALFLLAPGLLLGIFGMEDRPSWRSARSCCAS